MSLRGRFVWRGKSLGDYINLRDLLGVLEVSLPAIIAALSTHLLHKKKVRDTKKFDIKRHSIFDRIAFYDSIGIRVMETGKEGLRDFYMKKYAGIVLTIFRTRLAKLVEDMDSGTEHHLPNFFLEMTDAIKGEIQRSNIPRIFYMKIFAKESVSWTLVFEEVSGIQKTDRLDYYSKVLLFFSSVGLLFGNVMSGLELLCYSLNGELDKEIARIEREAKGILPDMEESEEEEYNG